MRKRIDITGDKYGMLHVLEETEPIFHKSGKKIRQYLCRCECGNRVVVRMNNLRTGNTTSCGCYNKKILKEKVFQDLSGLKFGRLTVSKRHESVNWTRYWFCLCECGNEVRVMASDLKSGHTKSCGCLQKEKASWSHGVYLKGKKFGRLTVIEEAGVKKRKRLWECICECGNTTILSTNALNRGNTKSCGCYALEMRGDKHPRYDPTITDAERENNRYRTGGVNPETWRKKVFERDNYTCVLCGQYGGRLNAHHLNGWNWFPKGRFDVENGVTLCEPCHKGFHKEYLNGNNTKEQFEEYKKKVLA